MDPQDSPRSNHSSNSQISRGGVIVDHLDRLSGQVEAFEAPTMEQALPSTQSDAPSTGSPRFAFRMSEANQGPMEQPGANDSDLASSILNQEKHAVSPTSIITLQVGERQFTTHVSTLTDQSDYFKSMFSGRWAVARLENGSYFFDADGDVFAHIIRFLRHQVYPVVYDQAKGHDYAMYMAIMNLAEFLGVSKLVAWIKGRKFHKAVSLTYHISHITSFVNQASENAISDQKCYFYPLARTRKVYLCPRRIFVHRDAPERCGQACERAKGGEPNEYDEENVLELLKVSETVAFNPTDMDDSSS